VNQHQAHLLANNSNPS